MPKKLHTIFLNLLKKALVFPLIILALAFTAKYLKYIPSIANIWNMNLILDDVGKFLTTFSYILFIFIFTKLICSEYKSYLQRSSDKIIFHIISIAENAINVLFTLMTVNAFLSSLNIPSYYVWLIHKIAILSVITAITWSLLEIISLAENIFHNRYLDRQSSQSFTLYTKIHILRNITKSVIIIIAIAASLMVFEKVRNVGISILASAGFLTAILALAAQKSFTSIITGVQIAISQPIKMGDYITIENLSGTVEEITLNYAAVRLSNGHRLIVPIQYFVDKSFQNWSKSVEGIVGTIKLYVNYNAPIQTIRAKLIEIVEQSKVWDKRKIDMAVSDLNENNVLLNISVSAVDPGNLDAVSKEIKEKLLNYLHEYHYESLPILRMQINELQPTNINIAKGTS